MEEIIEFSESSAIRSEKQEKSCVSEPPIRDGLVDRRSERILLEKKKEEKEENEGFTEFHGKNYDLWTLGSL